MEKNDPVELNKTEIHVRVETEITEKNVLSLMS